MDNLRTLLEQWATLEPTLCQLDFSHFHLTSSSKHWRTVRPDALESDALMWIQWAVQQAIISKGWYLRTEVMFSMSGELECYVTVRYCKEVTADNMAEALLLAYLKALQDSQ